METNKKKIRLDEVTIMRTILAFLIVFMHAFTYYQKNLVISWTVCIVLFIIFRPLKDSLAFKGTLPRAQRKI